jgi:hypothetical protein
MLLLHQKQQQDSMKRRAFVVGNGRSRLNANLEELKQKGRIYGCNALYRDFEPHVLIAVDPKMIIEICARQWQKTHEVWTNQNSKYRDITDLNYFNPTRGWSSGPTALLKACTDGYNEIFILGFDYQGIDHKVNNVYSNTDNYKKSDDPATYFGNWKKQTETVFNEFPQVNFFHVKGENTLTIHEWSRINNYKGISYEQLDVLIQ